MIYASIFVGMSLVLWILYNHWKAIKVVREKGKVPPSSMGLPLIGETIQFFTPFATLDVPPFIKHRVQRYGPVFKTNLVGTPIIVSTDVDVNNFIFQQEGKFFESWYVSSFNEIWGKDNMSLHQGSVHKYLRNLMLSLIGPQSLKHKILAQIQDNTRKNLQLWCSQGCVDIKQAISTMISNWGAEAVFSLRDKEVCRKLNQNYAAFIDGLISFPLYIPGTAFWKCIQGRKEAMKMIKKIVEKRKANPNTERKDFLDDILHEVDDENTILTENMAFDLLFLLPFVTYETTSSAMVLALKFLAENPAVLDQLTKEHETSLSNRRKNGFDNVTWEEYKSWTFTHKVMNETVRLANIAPVMCRRALKDVEIKGNLIPSGWIVMICPSAAHLNADKYEDPLTFNPWRWKEDEGNAGSKYFMAFGGGQRLCAGADFAKVQFAIFIHHLVLNYRWKNIKGNYVKKPALAFPNGFHVELFHKIA